MIQLAKNIWFILTLNCERSAELTSESFDRQLHWAERIAVRLHCLICGKSRKLNHQLNALNRKLDQVFSDGPASANFANAIKESSSGLSAEAKARIARQLSKYE